MVQRRTCRPAFAPTHSVGLAILSALISQACGSKTGLATPCEIDLEATPVEAILVVDHSEYAAFPYSAIVGDGGGIIYLSEFGPIVRTLEETLPILDADVRSPTSIGLYAYPEIGAAAIEREGFCALPPSMLVPIRRHNASVVVDQLNHWDDGSGNYWGREDLRPIGGAPVFAALQVVRSAFTDLRAPAARFVILVTMNATNCNPALRTPALCNCFDLPVQTCLSQPVGVETCSDSDRVVGAIASLAADGVQTMVVSDDFHDYAPGGPYDAFRRAAANAGGVEQAGAHPWYGVREPEAIAQALRDRVAPSGWCFPRSIRVPADPEAWTLHLSSVGTIARDRQHRDGWDWVDTSRGTIRLFGAACDSAMRLRAGLRLVSERQLCAE